MAREARGGGTLLLAMHAGSRRDSLAQGLLADGFQLTVAGTASEAAEVAASLEPDGILFASELTPMDRWHAVKRLHDHRGSRNIPVLSFDDDVGTPTGHAALVGRIRVAVARRRGVSPGNDAVDLVVTDAPAPVRSRHPSAPPRPVHIKRVSTPEPPVVSRDPLNTGRILVVDDEELNRDLLARRLLRKGYEVATASSGAEALEMLAAGGHDVVILDWMMPGLSGIDVLWKVRERWSQLQLPVIMATAKSETEDVVEALAQGANDYVTKPLNFNIVHARLRTQMGIVHLHRELRAGEERYRALLENTGDMVVQHRPGGRFTYVSPACRLLLGYEPEELMAEPLTHWIYPADRRALESDAQKWANPPPAFTWLARWRRKDGVYLWVETSCRLVSVGGESLVQAACRDVSEHMRRLPGDEPPLPLGGDIMAHPGWRAN